jgi:hypothetical protein
MTLLPRSAARRFCAEAVRSGARGFIEELICDELDAVPLYWHARVTGEAGWPAVKEERVLRATAMAAGRVR